jgi:hypothetical protein
MNTPRKLAALVGAGALVFAVAGTAAAVTDYATVSSHAASTSDNNSADFWGENCTKLDAGQGDLGAAVDSYVLLADYGKVIVKAGSGASVGDNALTIFDNPTAGQTVWADSNGDNTFNPGGKDGDKNISHIIFCDAASSSSTSFSSTVESTTDTSSSTSFTGSVESTTDTLPPTDTIGSTGNGQQSGAAWLLIASLGVLLGSAIVLAPARAKRQ